MTREELFALWAPTQSRWSVWAKPVLFAAMEDQVDVSSLKPLELPAVDRFPLPPGTAAIVDMEGANSVLYGLALAQLGYRPVPLYNSSIGPMMLVNMNTILYYLTFGARNLTTMTLADDAPPVFLLNADRLDHTHESLQPGLYDNRWCVVAQDMPSAEFLKDSGIRQVVLVAAQIREDLSHVLCRYQDAGIPVLCTPGLDTAPTPATVTKPRFYKSLVERFEVFAGLRRNAAGGFGAVIPEPNSSGGGFG